LVVWPAWLLRYREWLLVAVGIVGLGSVGLTCAWIDVLDEFVSVLD